MRIAISGAGVAGPALAWWLQRGGHEPVLIEQAPALRTGGYVIDFWGTGYEVADRMGLLPAIREAGYQVEEVRFVDSRGKRAGGFGVDVFQRLTGGRFVSLPRGDLAAILYRALDGKVETWFGDEVSAIAQEPEGVTVTTKRNGASRFDLLFGADGLHSGVRALAFGLEAGFDVRLGYYVAAFQAPGYAPRDPLVYVTHGEPGRQASRFAQRDGSSLILFVFTADKLAGPEPQSPAERKAALRAVYGDMGWECPRMLEAIERVDDVYFDRVSQIVMPAWSKQRVLLIGDAAGCVSLLAGEGTGLAMTEAYCLAGELHRAAGDHEAAFRAYGALLRPLIARKQQAARKFAAAFAPRTRFGIWLRNHVVSLFSIGPIADYLVGRDLRDELTLPAYGLEAGRFSGERRGAPARR